MAKFKIKTPNPLYCGVSEGVPFANGLGQTDDENIKNVLVNDYGYELVKDEKKAEEPKEAPAKKSSAK